MSSVIRGSLALTACALVSACGDGGGSSVNSTPAPTPTPTPAAFTSFANVSAGVPATVTGITREGSLVVTSAGAIPSGNVSQPVEATGSVTFTVNSARQITALTVTGAQSSVSFDTSSNAASILVSGVAVATALSNATGSNQAIYMDPYAVGFNYQTFGVWGSGLVPGSTGKFGAISVGVKTATSAVPTTGSATFHGYAGVIYTDTAGTAYRYGANATFNTNFANRTIAFATSGDGATRIADNVAVSVTGSITGNLTYAAGANTFNGTLSGLSMSGAAAGAFYGPSANELGGTFMISGAGGALVGGFGGKQ